MHAYMQVQEHLFLVGTEEGTIHKCSTAYSSEYLASFQGHDMAAYAVKWNRKHGRAFLSASPDWSVKLWDDSVSQVSHAVAHASAMQMSGATFLAEHLAQPKASPGQAELCLSA